MCTGTAKGTKRGMDEHVVGATLRDRGTDCVWLPSTRRGSFDPSWSFIARRAKGVQIEDTEGRTYLDLNSGLWNVSFGYDNEIILRHLEAGLSTLTSGTLFRRLNEPALEVAKRLTALVPHYARCFFTNSGSEAADIAFSICHSYWRALDRGGEPLVATLQGAYHGVTYTTLGMMGIDHYIQSAPTTRSTVRLPDPFAVDRDPVADLPHFFDTYGDRLCAVFVEHIQGSGGVRVLPDDYLAALYEHARALGALVVTDEVATGLHRTGPVFTSLRLPVQGDILIAGKALTGGYACMSVLAVTDNVFQAVTSFSGTDRLAGFTGSGHPLACSAALGVLELIGTEVFTSLRTTGCGALAGFVRRFLGSPAVVDVRGGGHMYGIVIHPKCIDSLGGPDAFIVMMTRLALSKGIVIHPLAIGVIPFFPALTSSVSELEEMVDRLLAALAGLPC
jgi:beta-alanine--pyruvate transaminase